MLSNVLYALSGCFVPALPFSARHARRALTARPSRPQGTLNVVELLDTAFERLLAARAKTGRGGARRRAAPGRPGAAEAGANALLSGVLSLMLTARAPARAASCWRWLAKPCVPEPCWLAQVRRVPREAGSRRTRASQALRGRLAPDVCGGPQMAQHGGGARLLADQGALPRFLALARWLLAPEGAGARLPPHGLTEASGSLPACACIARAAPLSAGSWSRGWFTLPAVTLPAPLTTAD
jgi:hypothetical protein